MTLFLRDALNEIISSAEKSRNIHMPRIGDSHACRRGGIFLLLRDPGVSTGEGTTGAALSRCVSFDNDDKTARTCKEMCKRLDIPLSEITPWNAVGGFNEKKKTKSVTERMLDENEPLCQSLLDTAAPVAMIALGNDAQRMAKRLKFNAPLFFGPHPGPLGKLNYVKNNGGNFKDAERLIDSLFIDAHALVNPAW